MGLRFHRRKPVFCFEPVCRFSFILGIILVSVIQFCPDPIFAESSILPQDQHFYETVFGDEGLVPVVHGSSSVQPISSNLVDKKNASANGNGQAFDFGTPPKTKNFITPSLSYGVRFGLEYIYEKDFNLEYTNPEDLTTFQPSLSLAISYNPSDYFSAFVNIEMAGQVIDDQENKRVSGDQLKLNQAFLTFTPIKNSLSISAGRQRIRDDRQWIYDEELDAIRLTYGFSRVGFEFSVSESKDKDLLSHNDDPELINFMGNIKFSFAPNNVLSLYSFVQDDHSVEPEDVAFYGLQVNGEMMKRLEYWVEFAHLRGRSGPDKIRGYGFDVGLTKIFKTFLNPSITLGFAYGSGDKDSADNTDKNFRQTGFQDNNAAFNGVTRIQYYGELVDPELSNLSIFTGGLGFRIGKNTSLDFVYHRYRQNELAVEFRDTELEDRPNGENKGIGHEIDAIVAYRNRKSGVTMSLIAGYFIPGRAFPKEADDAFFFETKIRYDF